MVCNSHVPNNRGGWNNLGLENFQNINNRGGGGGGINGWGVCGNLDINKSYELGLPSAKYSKYSTFICFLPVFVYYWWVYMEYCMEFHCHRIVPMN